MGAPEDSFFDEVTEPHSVTSWLLAFVEHTLAGSSEGELGRAGLHVAPQLLAHCEMGELSDQLAQLGVELYAYDTDHDLVDLVDGDGYAHLLYLPPPPYCTRAELVRRHNSARWNRSGMRHWPEVPEGLTPEVEEAYTTFVVDGMDSPDALTAAEVLTTRR